MRCLHTGNIAVARPDPVIFLEYLNNREATQKKFAGPNKEWLVSCAFCRFSISGGSLLNAALRRKITGDLGKQDERGYIRFVGRDDDLIKTSGYRVGPAEAWAGGRRRKSGGCKKRRLCVCEGVSVAHERLCALDRSRRR